MKTVLEVVYKAMAEKGYNPVNQIVGYIMSGDPTYITSHKNAPQHDYEGGAGRTGRGTAERVYQEQVMDTAIVRDRIMAWISGQRQWG